MLRYLLWRDISYMSEAVWTVFHNTREVQKQSFVFCKPPKTDWNENSIRLSEHGVVLFQLLQVKIARNRISLSWNATCDQLPELTDFLDYVQRNYLNANGSSPPQMWNVLGRTMDNRTNNNVENKYESHFFYLFIWEGISQGNLYG
jgi:hypothetical protein